MKIHEIFPILISQDKIDNHDEKLHVVYDGKSPADYPGDNSHYTMGVH